MIFHSSLNAVDITNYTMNQLNNVFPDKNIVTFELIHDGVVEALNRVYNNFSHIKGKYYRDGDTTLFNHLNGDHYCVYLYYLSNTLYKKGYSDWLCSKVFYLNKLLHGIDAFYSVELPEHFMVIHPLGTVLGNAKYGDYMIFYQGVTIGASAEGIYPEFEGQNILYSQSAVIGNLNVGSNAIIANGVRVTNQNIPSNTLVFGGKDGLVFKENRKKIIETIFQI